jgi:HEAT repeat protein
MNQFIPIFSSLPLWLIVVDITAAAVLLAGILLSLVTFFRLRRAMSAAIESWNRYREPRPARLPAGLLDLFSGVIEKRSMESGVNLLEIFGLQDRLVSRISGSGKSPRLSRKEARRLLTFSPDRALFPIFLAACRRKKIAAELENWLEGAGELFVLRRLALGSEGIDFDGAAAARLFSSRIEEVRTLADDTDFRARLFALRILVRLEDERSRELAFAALSDGHPDVRRTAALLVPMPPPEQPKAEKERERLRKTLLGMITDDPSYEVRSTVAVRLFSLFPDTRLPGAKELEPVAAIRIAEQLHPEKSEDQELAFRFLLSKDPELSLIAARFLDNCGSFAKLFAAADHGDREGMKRIETILRKGMQSHCCHYLRILGQADFLQPGPLLIASRILLPEGDKKLVTALLERALSLPDEVKKRSDGREILLNALKAAAARGNEDARRFLGHTLEQNARDAELQKAVIENLPADGAEELIEPLFSLLTDPGYPEEELLISYISGLPAEMSVHHLVDLVRAGRTISLVARKRAVRILLRRGEFAGIQRMLEELPLLDMEEAAECGRWLEQFIPSGLEERIARIFAGHDALLRARLIAALPPALRLRFRKTIKEAVTDREQEVRIAAAHVLFQEASGKTGDGSLPLDLLHDPVPLVRETVARLAGEHRSGYAALKELIMDPNEVESVKEAALCGIAEAGGLQSAQFLLEVMEKELELEEEIIAAAGSLTEGEEFAPFLARMETAPDQLRKRITAALIRAGKHAEDSLLSLLDQPEPVRSQAASALEEIGTVDRTMRKLGSRNAGERLAAAELLSRIGTVNAFRGIVLSVKDPSEPVRVEAARAVQKLKDERGTAILEQLEKDPVPRVRRYARWARERLLAETLG